MWSFSFHETFHNGGRKFTKYKGKQEGPSVKTGFLYMKGRVEWRAGDRLRTFGIGVAHRTFTRAASDHVEQFDPKQPEC